MQQYRINYRILIGLVVGFFVSAILLHFLWKWQVDRKATWYRDTAEVALEEEDTLKAFQYMQFFMGLRREDEEARVKLASIAFDVLHLEGAPRDEQSDAFRIISDTVRRTSDLETRRKLADLYFEMADARQSEQQAAQALIHYEELLKTSDDPELKARHVRSLFIAKDYQNAMRQAYELIGLDPETETFDDEKAEAANQPEVYAAVANVLLYRENDKELAEKIIDKMIENNPDSAVAHFQKSLYLSAEDEEAAVAELEKAYELDPENPRILARKIQLARLDDDPNQAIELAKSGIERFPKILIFYIYCAESFQLADRYEEAIAVLDEGILEFGEQSSVELFKKKFDISLSAENIKACLNVISELEDLKEPGLQPLIDYEKARITFFNKQWRSAARQLNVVRPQLVRDRELQIHAGFLLASAYEELGMIDKAIEYFRLLSNDETIPDSNRLKRMALTKKAKLEQDIGIGKGTEAMDFDSIVQREIDKPKSEQNWPKVYEYLDKLVEINDLTESRRLLIESNIFRKRGMLEEAKDKIRAALKLDPDDVTIKLTAAQLLLIDLPDGPAKAMNLLKQIEAKSGVTLQTRLLTMEAILRTYKGEEVKSELLSVTQNTESFSKQDRSKLFETLGEFFARIGDVEQAESLTLQAAELDPDDLPLRNRLFELALSRRDDDAMQRAQEMILDLVERKDDGAYVLAEVRRRIVNYRGSTAGRKGLEEARKMLDDVLERRPQWHELHIVYAQLLLVLRQDMDLVLEHFDDALRYGPPNPMALAQQVTILTENGLMDQARERMELMPERNRNRLLGTTEANILLSSGDTEAAFESAAATAEREIDNARTQAWFGNIADTAGKLEEAAQAYQRATELNPKSEQFWLKLVATHAKLENPDGLVRAMRMAQLSLEPEMVPRFQATFFELQKQWKNAEGIYMSLFGEDYETNPDSARQLAAFYYRWGSVDQEMIPYSYPYINALIRAGHEGKLKPDDQVLLWALEKGASFLASNNNYQDFRKALAMIRQGTEDGSIPRTLMPLYLKILTSRSDPKSVEEAIGILAPMYTRGTLSKSDELLLARLYERTLQWEKGKDLMLDALSKYGADEEVWSTYITLLIKQGEYSTAKGRIDRFDDIASNPGTVARLRASLAYEQGDSAGVKKTLSSMLPPSARGGGAMSANDLKIIKAVAAMAIEYGEYDSAEQLLRIYVRRKNPDGLFELVSLLATHGNVDEALQMMDGLFPSDPLAIARLSVQALRERGRELDELQIDHLWSFVERVVDERPDSADRLMMRAEGYELLEKYDEAIADYENALELGLSPLKKAVALNNLAYLLANTDQRLDEAAEMIQGAADVLGPLADIMDTRAVIRMAREEYDLAVEDMISALSIDPTASKYYHLARAQALAGNSAEAVEAWDKARDMDIEKEDLPLMEQSSYDATERLIRQLQDQ